MGAVNYLELVGYLASVLVAISLMMLSLNKLRVINLSGSLLFTVYGFTNGAYPVAVLNAFIVLVNIFYLQKAFKVQAG
jgi:uncharacterized membrane protein